MTQNTKQKILGGLTYQSFLAEYWQQKPLLVRQAFNGSPIDISAEELAGIACDTDAPSRIVIEHGTGTTPWESLFGPFDDDIFASLPPSHWTLLVNDVERYFPQLRQIITQFQFIPNWRLDDLMLSYATHQGSVGPHTDEYDVMLIQTSGRRKWCIDSRENYNKETRIDCSLSILQSFDADYEWILEPGDMLYLPPNMPHYGIAQDDECMTLSVGFHAPSQHELIYNWVESVSNSPEFEQRYNDQGRQWQQHPAEISQYDIDRLSNLISEGIDTKKETLSLWLGKYLTETKGEVAVNLETNNLETNVEQAEKQPSTLVYKRQNWLRLAYIEAKEGIHFFADGEHFLLESKTKNAILYLCDHYIYKKSIIKQYYKQYPCFKVVFDKIRKNNTII